MISYHPVRLAQAAVPRLSPMPIVQAPAANGPPSASGNLLTLGGIALVALGIAAGGTWIGVRTGLQEKGFLSLTGWTVGVVSGVAALANLATLVAAGVLLVRTASETKFAGKSA